MDAHVALLGLLLGGYDLEKEPKKSKYINFAIMTAFGVRLILSASVFEETRADARNEKQTACFYLLKTSNEFLSRLTSSLLHQWSLITPLYRHSYDVFIIILS